MKSDDSQSIFSCVRPELDYMTRAESELFRRLRKTSEISFFRTALCEVCSAEIPKTKRCCSKDCWDSAWQASEAVESFLRALLPQDEPKPKRSTRRR